MIYTFQIISSKTPYRSLHSTFRGLRRQQIAVTVRSVCFAVSIKANTHKINFQCFRNARTVHILHTYMDDDRVGIFLILAERELNTFLSDVFWRRHASTRDKKQKKSKLYKSKSIYRSINIETSPPTFSFARSACSMLIPVPLESFTLDWNSPDVSFERGLRAKVHGLNPEAAVGPREGSRRKSPRDTRSIKLCVILSFLPVQV